MTTERMDFLVAPTTSSMSTKTSSSFGTGYGQPFKRSVVFSNVPLAMMMRAFFASRRRVRCLARSSAVSSGLVFSTTPISSSALLLPEDDVQRESVLRGEGGMLTEGAITGAGTGLRSGCTVRGALATDRFDRSTEEAPVPRRAGFLAAWPFF